ncbi:MAG: hypothetical protein JSS98_04545 [Bacteroidetes bacterium]|nr:hypothetical protein [Bacteroidota bacterium]
MDTTANNLDNDIGSFLSRRLGEKEAADIMATVNEEVAKRVDARIAASRAEISAWRDEIKANFATKEDAANLEKKLIKRVSEVEGTIILWGIVFWITIIIAVYIIFKFVQA